MRRTAGVSSTFNLRPVAVGVNREEAGDVGMPAARGEGGLWVGLRYRPDGSTFQAVPMEDEDEGDE